MASSAQPPENTVGGVGPSPRLLAFYLPQFHPIPENDVSWGEGFTEWTNVARARPRFPGHYQPRLPADLGFYDLRLPEVRQAQADLAREHGISGFVYYHYWFKGRRLLERPLDEMLASGEPDFPFCLCWGNHTWTWKRDISERGRIVPQEYSEEDDREHIRWLLETFADERYIRVNGHPLLLVFQTHGVPDPVRRFEVWREEALCAGQAEPYVCKVESYGDWEDPAEFGCDASTEFWPHKVEALGLEPIQERGMGPQSSTVFEYEDLMKKHLARPEPDFKRFPCVVPQWDNTARFKSNGARILHGSTPELYERWLRAVIEKGAGKPPDEQLVFINAWNEWAEGAYLEPDFRYGRAYLEATRRAVLGSGVSVPVPGTGKKGDPPPIATAEARYKDLLDKYKLLQRRYDEQLSREENSVLLKKAERQIAELREENLRVRNRNKIIQSDKNVMTHLAREMVNGIDILLNSTRWKVGSMVFEAPQRLFGRPRKPSVVDHLTEVSRKVRSRLDNPHDPPAPDRPQRPAGEKG